ncbi:putative capsid protein [Asterias forbesi associated circular virus]|nr:putative capsid protein [Asterias forbesi associated circular virus]
MPRNTRRRTGRSRRRRTLRRGYRKFTGGRGITKEHDRTNIYYKKRMPRFKKRRWRRFSKKVQNVSEKDLGTQTVVFNDQIETGDFFNSDGLITGSATLCLYSMNGSEVPYNDLAVMMNNLNFAAPTVDLGTTKYRTSKVIFKSAVFDLTLTNTSYDRIGGVNNIEAAYSLEVDIHTVVIKKGARDLDFISGTLAEKGLKTIDKMIEVAEKEVRPIGGDDSKIFNTTKAKFNRGGTLWDVPHALSLFGMKILSKKKYFIPGGATITYQMRDAKRRVMVPQFNMLGVNKPGWTKFLYITYKLVPGVGVIGQDENVPTQIRTRLSVGVTRKYSYKIEGQNDVRDNYNPDL